MTSVKKHAPNYPECPDNFSSVTKQLVLFFLRYGDMFISVLLLLCYYVSPLRFSESPLIWQNEEFCSHLADHQTTVTGCMFHKSNIGSGLVRHW